MEKKISVRAPKGFHFGVTVDRYSYSNGDYKRKRQPCLVTIELYKNDDTMPIGGIELERDGRNRYITHSSLVDEYRKQGLGTLMYAKAIKWCHDHGYRVGSSSGPSDMAQRVWNGKGLRKYFRIRKYKNREYGRSNYVYSAHPKRK
jgi:GNAT superfamily N-acetyltransferase